jgi:LysR family carnitine catabolism transcriptional activator
MVMNITLQQLNSFLRIAQLGSFSRAARNLAVSQPALSRTIRLMEDALGARLFDRDTRNLNLTPTGLELRPVAERFLSDYEAAFGELALFVAGRRGRIVVAALPSIAAAVLPSAIAELKANFSDVEVIIRDGLSDDVLDSVSQGRAELGLTIQPIPNSKLKYKALGEEPFGLICRSDDPLARERVLPWSVFAKRPFIAMAAASSVRAMTNAAFLQIGLALTPRYECSFLGTASHLIDRGLGIAAAPRLALPLMAAPNLVFRPLRKPIVRRQVGVVTRIGSTFSPAAQAFLEFVELEARRVLLK